jgi:site-specific DNA recombinase
MAVPPIIDAAEFEVVQMLLKTRSPALTAPRVPMEKLDSVVAEHIEQRLLQPKRLEQILSAARHRRKEQAERRTAHIGELRKRGSEAEAKLKWPLRRYR